MKLFLHIIALTFSFCWGGLLHAQTFQDIFLKMPQEVCPVLSEYNRLELVDNQKNGKALRTRNLLQTFSEMKEMTGNYAHLQVSERSEKTFVMLPQNDGTSVVMLMNTIRTDDGVDASLSFYTTDWKPLPAETFIDAAVSDDFRSIDVDRESLQLTITTDNAPLTLQFEGNKAQSASISTIYRWNAEQDRFVILDKKERLLP